MLSNPFVFMRGSAQLFYADLAGGEIPLPKLCQSWPHTTIMGDCHLSNFGFFTEEGSHGEQIIFGPNDFDDACIGNPAWDLVRFLASIELCRDYCQGLLEGLYPPLEEPKGEHCLSTDHAHKAQLAFLHTYRKTLKKSVKKPDYRYRAVNSFNRSKLMRKAYKKACERSTGGQKFSRKSSLAKAVDLTLVPLKFRNRPGRYKRLDAATVSHIIHTFAPYVDDQILDVVQRQDAGTGSVNMARYYLLVGPTDTPGEAQWPLFHVVEVKCQREAAPLHYFDHLPPMNRLNPAHLTVNCQRLMARRPDIVLDEVVWQDAHWLVRSRHHARYNLDPEQIATAKGSVKHNFLDYVKHCARALALAHARGDIRSTEFERRLSTELPEVADDLRLAADKNAQQIKADRLWLAEVLTP
nr:DUF2252 family protein [Gilvimarinus xylanilyticus]